MLCRAIQSGKLSAVRRLLANKSNHASIGVHDPETGLTPLHVAAGKGLVEIARLLIDSGAPVDAVPSFGPGATPLRNGSAITRPWCQGDFNLFVGISTT